MFIAIYAFENSFTNIMTITFSALIVIEMLNIVSEVHVIKWPMVVSIALTLIVYFMTIIFLRSYI